MEHLAQSYAHRIDLSKSEQISGNRLQHSLQMWYKKNPNTQSWTGNDTSKQNLLTVETRFILPHNGKPKHSCMQKWPFYTSVFCFLCLTLQRYLHKTQSCLCVRGIICSNCLFPHLKPQHPPCYIITLLHCHRLRNISSGVKKAEGTEVNPWMKKTYMWTHFPGNEKANTQAEWKKFQYRCFKCKMLSN